MSSLDFDTSAFGNVISQWLLCKGSAIPPLQWQVRANKMIKQQLDAIPTAGFLGSNPIKNAEAAEAVRGGIYFWNGFLKECVQICNVPNCPEHLYWQALCFRHVGQPDAAKKLFQKIQGHPIQIKLLSKCREVIGHCADKPIRRFLDTINQVECFEAFAFIDLYEMARLGKANEVANKIVCSIQSSEFGLLLAHCYKQACPSMAAAACA